MPVKGADKESDSGTAWTREHYNANSLFTGLSSHAAVKSTVRAALVAKYPDVSKKAEVAAVVVAPAGGMGMDTDMTADAAHT